MTRNVLSQIPFLDHLPKDGRNIFLQPYYDDKEKTFKLFLQKGNNLSHVIAIPSKCCYWSNKIVDKNQDIFINFIDVIAKHFSFEPVMKDLFRIILDVCNLSTFVEKYFIYLDLFRKNKDVSISNMIVTDIECIFGNVRSLYDLLQNITKYLWYKENKIQLPESFEKMVNKKRKELKEKYEMAEPLINYYEGTRNFFYRCRKIRNGIYHRGTDIQVAFCLEDGFAFMKKGPLPIDPITSEFDIWPSEKIKKNGMVSILALIAYINKKILLDIDDFSNALSQSINLQKTISKNYNLYLRGPYIHHLIKSEEYLEQQWISIE